MKVRIVEHGIDRGIYFGSQEELDWFLRNPLCAGVNLEAGLPKAFFMDGLPTRVSVPDPADAQNPDAPPADHPLSP